MFKFGFSTENSSLPESNLDSELPQGDLEWLPSKEVLVAVGKEPEFNESDIETIQVGPDFTFNSIQVITRLQYIKPSSLLNIVLGNEKATLDESVALAEKNHSDLLPSKYEGGFKIWECTSDIANFLVPNLVTEKAVLDLGCGGGLLGILALKLGAEIVHFQDYNADVLQYSTIPNVQINSDSNPITKCRFFSGDWSSFTDVSESQYDLILSSETIYNPINYSKLHDCLERSLKPKGTILLGAKSYYFGVGGSTRQFEQLVRKKKIFEIEVVWKYTEGVQREILQLRFKDER